MSKVLLLDFSQWRQKSPWLVVVVYGFGTTSNRSLQKLYWDEYVECSTQSITELPKLPNPAHHIIPHLTSSKTSLTASNFSKLSSTAARATSPSSITHPKKTSQQTAMFSRKSSSRRRRSKMVHTLRAFNSQFHSQLKENVWVKKTLIAFPSNIFSFIFGLIG